MNGLVRIAAKNLLRQRRRSALTGASIVIGVTFALFTICFFNGVIETFMRATVEANIGAIQVHKKGYADAEQPLKLDLGADDAVASKVRAVKNVKAIAPRLAFEGLINNGTSASILLGTAISPKEELEVCPGRADQIGATKLEGDTVVLGDELASTLNIPLGGSATILAPSQAGPSNALDVTVGGMLEVKVPIAAKTVGVFSLPFAQKLLRMPGRVTELAIGVENLRTLEETRQEIRAALGPDYDVETWQEREPAAAQGIARFNVIIVIIVVILLLLVGSGVINSMLMSVQERVREIGTMMAVGVRRRQVLSIILAEAAVLAFVAASAGTLIGLALTWYFGTKGVTFAPRGAKPLVVFPFVTGALIAKMMIGAVVASIAAAFYPALKASRLSPVEALRSV